jgi:NAD-dependent deacetylase
VAGAPDDALESAIEQLAVLLTPDARVTVLTGAGVSSASGVPTFRGSDGLWKNLRVEDLATPEAFARNPLLVWQWYDWRRQAIARCQPNAAHHVLTSWSLRFPRFTLVSQNVDGLHDRAGTMGPVTLHGSIWDVRCWNDCASAPERWRDDTTPFPSLPPPCPHCGGPLRPGVVWFGEMLDAGAVARSASATRCDVFLTIGTSAVVYPAAGFIEQAAAAGAFTVEINPEATPASAFVDLVIAAGAERVLPPVDRRLGPHPLTLQTERLTLLPLLPASLDSAHAVWTDADVRRFLWDDVQIPRETAEAVLLAGARDFADRRFGLWAVHTRDAPDVLAGFCGLRSDRIGSEPELLFGLTRDHWGKGLAHEAGRAVIDYAFGTLRLPAIVAATDVPNERSARTLERLGMSLERRALHNGLDTLFFRLSADAEARLRQPTGEHR